MVKIFKRHEVMKFLSGLKYAFADAQWGYIYISFMKVMKWKKSLHWTKTILSLTKSLPKTR